MSYNKTTLLFISFTFLLFSGCQKSVLDYGNGGSSGKDKFDFDVEWTPGTVYFDEDALSDLEKVDTADYRYYFSSSNDAAASLASGDIIVIHGLALRKVSSVRTANNQVVVETEYATLNEAVSDGTIEWDYGVSFTPDLKPELLVNGQAHRFKRTSDDTFSISMKIGKYDYKITMKFKGDKADVTQEIERTVGNITKVRFGCEGVIEQFRTSNKITYKDAEVTYYENSNKGLKGDLTVFLDAAGSGSDNINFEFPVTLIKFPFTVGPIPVTVNLKVMFVAKAVVPPEGSSRVSAKFSYNSSTGIKYSWGGGLEVNGDKGSYKIKKERAQTGAASAIGINFGLGFPRLEVGIFGETIVPWVQTAFLVGGDFTFMPACQQAKAAYIGACGYKLGFLGLGYEGTKTLWNIEEVLLKSGDCGGQSPLFKESSELLAPGLK
ncbi:MAG: hypothetical protein J7L96_00370 [Bacteroidales bacterium]|nr:hypothetical protein [Bacteroidales bacterium]